MKAIDTNILIRFLVDDDQKQSAKVKSLFKNAENRNEQYFITIPVLLETIWVLESSYNCPRPVIIDAIEQITLMPIFKFEALGRIEKMIGLGRKQNYNLADLLIGLSAIDLGCESTLTFDKKASKSELFDPL